MLLSSTAGETHLSLNLSDKDNVKNTFYSNILCRGIRAMKGKNI